MHYLQLLLNNVIQTDMITYFIIFMFYVEWNIFFNSSTCELCRVKIIKFPPLNKSENFEY